MSNASVTSEARGSGRRRKPRDSAATSASILAAATKEFAAYGFGGGRVDRISERAGVNKRMIYHYYGDKRGLYLAVLEQAYHRERSAEQTLELAALEPREAMQRLIEYTFDSFVKDRSFIKLLNDENLHKAANLKRSKRIAEMHSPLIAIMQKILERGARSGRLPQRRRSAADVDFDRGGELFLFLQHLHALDHLQARFRQGRSARGAAAPRGRPGALLPAAVTFGQPVRCGTRMAAPMPRPLLCRGGTCCCAVRMQWHGACRVLAVPLGVPWPSRLLCRRVCRAPHLAALDAVPRRPGGA